MRSNYKTKTFTAAGVTKTGRLPDRSPMKSASRCPVQDAVEYAIVLDGADLLETLELELRSAQMDGGNEVLRMQRITDLTARIADVSDTIRPLVAQVYEREFG